jgi:hypothetical protein
MKVWQSGLGATGSLFGGNYPLYLGAASDVIYVDSVLGDDANAGTDEKAPKATLGSAITAADDDDIIVLSSTHDETVSTALSVTKRIAILGSGSSGGNPSSKLTLAVGSDVGLTFGTGSAGSVLSNVRFPAGTITGATNSKVKLTERCTVDACLIEQGNTDAGYGLHVASTTGARVARTTITSEVTNEAMKHPVCGLQVDVAAASLQVDQVTLDNGLYGWSGGYGMRVTLSSTGLLVTALTLLRGSDVYLASGVSGSVHVALVTGNGRIVW